MKLGKYKHFKGEIVEVLCVARHTETAEEFVIYRHSDGNIWARPLVMFIEEVDKPKQNHKGPRFVYVGLDSGNTE
jgi:hypothetical protein